MRYACTFDLTSKEPARRGWILGFCSSYYDICTYDDKVDWRPSIEAIIEKEDGRLESWPLADIHIGDKHDDLET